jgi:hypothetical protein
MAASKLSRSQHVRRERAKLRQQMGTELCSVNAYRSDSLTTDQLAARENPADKRDLFATARKWREENWFVGAILALKADCVGFGQTLGPKDKKKKKEFEAWLEKLDARGRASNRMLVEKYLRTAIDELLLQQNLVSFWRPGVAPYPLLTEHCTYRDALGAETLRVRMCYSAEDLKEAGFAKADIDRYSKGEILLTESRGEFFRVFTWGLTGTGFGIPRMKEVFRTCSQNESMEVGESLYAYVGRTVLRMHHLGWEVKKDAGMRQTDAMWDKSRAKGIEKFFKGLQGGVAELTANFDHKVSLVWLDPKNYEAKKWETIVARLMWWGGPLAFMLTARNLNPNFMPLFKAEVKKFRADVKPHLEHVLTQALQPPGGIQVDWTDECFADMRLLWDMIKTLMQQGPASLTTAQRFAGLNPEVEAENKVTETDDPDSDKKYLPKYTPGTGNRPADPGRKAGVGDGGGQGGAPATKAK